MPETAAVAPKKPWLGKRLAAALETLGTPSSAPDAPARALKPRADGLSPRSAALLCAQLIVERSELLAALDDPKEFSSEMLEDGEDAVASMKPAELRAFADNVFASCPAAWGMLCKQNTIGLAQVLRATKRPVHPLGSAGYQDIVSRLTVAPQELRPMSTPTLASERAKAKG